MNEWIDSSIQCFQGPIHSPVHTQYIYIYKKQNHRAFLSCVFLNLSEYEWLALAWKPWTAPALTLTHPDADSALRISQVWKGSAESHKSPTAIVIAVLLFYQGWDGHEKKSKNFMYLPALQCNQYAQVIESYVAGQQANSTKRP